MAQTPRYREVSDDLRDAIMNEGEVMGVQLRDGAKLPTEPELERHFQVSRGTVRQALKELTAEGFIETRGRGGTYVRRLPLLAYSVDAESPYRHDTSPDTSDTWFSVVEAEGRKPTQDFRFRIEPATATVAGRLRLEANELVVVREMLRYVDDIPWSDQITYYPSDIANRCGIDVPENIPEGTIRRMAKHGIIEVRLEHEISSRPASEDERRRFDLGPGVSVLIFRRVGYSDGRPVRYTQETLPADRNVITHVSEIDKDGHA